jgi:hypothetical protein
VPVVGYVRGKRGLKPSTTRVGKGKEVVVDPVPLDSELMLSAIGDVVEFFVQLHLQENGRERAQIVAPRR